MKHYQKHRDIIDYHTPISKSLNDVVNLSIEDRVAYEAVNLVAGPVIISYVLWLVNDAKNKGIKRLYFLARDGMIMYKIAKIYVQEMNISIDVRYLYLSRISLRRALFYIDGKEVLRQATERTTNLRVMDILESLPLNDFQKEELLSGLENISENELLTNEKVTEIEKLILGNKRIWNQMKQTSKNSYQLFIAYLEQELFFEDCRIALVDSGWKGTIQKNLEKIIRFEKDMQIELMGYYFGIENYGTLIKKGYNSFFLKDDKIFRRVTLNKNLFELFCSANHGMTLDYKRTEGLIVPVISDACNLEFSNFQMDAIEKLFSCVVKENKDNEVAFESLNKLIEKPLFFYMMFPSKSVVKFYGEQNFNNEVSDSKYTFASKLTKNEYYENMTLMRMYRCITRTKSIQHRQTLWVPGSIMLVENSLLRVFFMLDYFSWILVKYAGYKLISLKSGRRK